MPVAEALASDHVLAQSPSILANLLRCWPRRLSTRSTRIRVDLFGCFNSGCRPTSPPFGRRSLTFFLPRCLVSSRSAPPHQAEEVFKYFFGLEDFSDDEFLVCRRRNYSSSINLPTSVWSDGEDGALRQNWGSFVLQCDLPLGCVARRASWEVYHPQFTARQFGYLQGCPVPLLRSRSLLS